MNDSKTSWRTRVRRTLDQRAGELDGSTLSGLNRARQTALDEARHATKSWLPAGLVAAAAVVALAVGIGLRTPAPDLLLPPEYAPEVALLTSDEALEMLEELEFYAWLDEALTDAG